jgi:hypothetical protein
MTEYKNGKDLSLEQKIEEVEKALLEFKSNGAAKKIKCDSRILILKIKELKALIEESI